MSAGLDKSIHLWDVSRLAEGALEATPVASTLDGAEAAALPPAPAVAAADPADATFRPVRGTLSAMLYANVYSFSTKETPGPSTRARIRVRRHRADAATAWA